MVRRGALPLALLAALAALTAVSGQGRPVTDNGAGNPSTLPSKFTPKDAFYVDCGGTADVDTKDGKAFKTDAQSNQLLAAKDAIKVADDKADVPSPVYRTARIFKEEAVYSFPLTVPGWHFIRLYFFPLKNGDFDLSKATFSVETDTNVLLHSFTADAKPVMKEYLVNATENKLDLKFTPMTSSAAFINAIEVVNAPDELITDTALTVSPLAETSGLSEAAYQMVYRLNVGGPSIGPVNDTLGRQWDNDGPYVQPKDAAQDVSVPPSTIKYPDTYPASKLIAPTLVYASAAHMAESGVQNANFNVTWKMGVDPAFGYFVRLFFADIISKSTNDLYFNVYINGRKAISGLDLSTITGELAAPYYKDFVVNSSIGTDQLSIQIGPMGEDTGRIDALLNGVEVLKMSNSVGSLDGEFGVDGRTADDGSGTRKVVAAVGFAMMFGAFAGLGAMVMKWYKRPQDWERRNSFSSWLLPIHTGQSFANGKGSKSGYTFSSTTGLGRFFSFAEMQEATKNFDDSAIIGVGGFGNVYVGVIDDGTKVAIKRGNPQSEQGINEFNTEIQMLSKLRHRHLVSLIGYCDENEEMILVYEYMHNGPFRDHVYGGSADLPPLSWKQRLEICIGAARGLHYLHTGTAQGIIHRDVKTTNILLDENFVAKVADFGLSKDGPGMNQLHVSTAVKGSFGYLDPEYFRCQQLTDKSDVYSFGVVLLETLCARAPIDPQLPREQVSLAEWGMQWKRKGLIEKIMDPKLAGKVNPESLAKFAETAEKCLAEFGSDRISMGDVLWNLEYALQMQEANPPEGAADGTDGDDPDASIVTTSSASTGVHTVPDASTTSANELFAQLADMKGR
ncbi:probable receptor-like protein kinase At4g39110 [Lolium perenne]|uniref:probable receptor-like protein kinase At4g39110 n=1 Tax=Lolium perenne TaxID=4522 RepID=UPI0021EAD607|nr:probable receptor-like protein kinase At4g39110 [Lolium perenne]